MRLTIEHRIVLRPPAPSPRLVQRLRLTPTNSHDQTVVSWRIDLDRDARLRTGRDGFGNIVTMLYAEGPLDALQIVVVGEVVTSHSGGVLHGVPEALPPALYCRADALDPAVEALAREAAAGRDRLAALHALNAALAERGEGEGDDRTRLFVAAARALGAPARHVGGYRLGNDRHSGPHGWAEAFVERIGWIGFDPATGLSPEEEYVRVAIGLDAAGAAPVAGLPATAAEVAVTRQD